MLFMPENEGVGHTVKKNKPVGNKRNFFPHHKIITSWRAPKIIVYILSHSHIHFNAELNLGQLYELAADFSVSLYGSVLFFSYSDPPSSSVLSRNTESDVEQPAKGSGKV